MADANYSVSNGTFVDADRLRLLEWCENNEQVPFVYMATTPIWCCLLIEWAYNTYVANSASALELHRMLLALPAVGVLHSALSIPHYKMCPWDLVVEQLVYTAWFVVTILKEPVILVCLLMVAKGWCITRSALPQREIATASAIIMALYVSIVVRLSVRSLWGAVPLLFMWTCMLYLLLSSILTNLRVLKAQLIALRSFNVDATTTPAYTKYRMFRALIVYASLYMAVDLGLYVAYTQRLLTPVSGTAARQGLELIAALAIGHAFRARPLNVMFEEVQQLAVELAQDLLPQLSTVTIDVAALRGDGTVPWRSDMDLRHTKEESERAPPPMLLVLNPADDAQEPETVLAASGALVVATRVPPATALASAAPPRRGLAGGEAPGAPPDGGGGVGAPRRPPRWRGLTAGASGESGESGEGGEGGGDAQPVPMATLRDLLGAATPWGDGGGGGGSASGIALAETGGRAPLRAQTAGGAGSVTVASL